MSTTEIKKSQFRERLDRISPTLCLAKSLQLSLHLQSGESHSCYLSPGHIPPLEELRRDPSAFHNSALKKELRHRLKCGERIEDCKTCWDMETTSPHLPSDRILKSSSEWASPLFDKVAHLAADASVNPSYLEVSFDNICNFNCSYCSADFSTGWAHDLKRHGPYPTGSGQASLKTFEPEENPYLDAFWKWWPRLVSDLKILRLTGGEPLMSPNTFRLLEHLLKNPRPHLELAINSNLGVPDSRFEEFLSIATELRDRGCVKKLGLYTSCEAWGAKAEYIRTGLQFGKFTRNLETLLERLPRLEISITATFNALSATSFKDLLIYVRRLREFYARPDQKLPIDVDIFPLEQPAFQSALILPADYLPAVQDIYDYVCQEQWDHQNPSGFYYYQRVRAQHLLNQMTRNSTSAEELARLRKDFYLFFSERDRRHGTRFLDVFPEMTDFWRQCEALAEVPLS